MDSWSTPPSNSTSAGDREDIVLIITNIVGIVMVTIIAIIGIVGNILNLIVIPRIPEGTLGEATRVFYSALAVADLMTAAVLLSGPFFYTYNGWIASTSGNIFCKVTGFLGTCAPPVGAIFIFLLNVDRYIQVTRPFLYDNLAIRKKAVVSVVIAALCIVGVVLLCVALSKRSFSVIIFIEELGVCQVNFSDPSFLPYTVAMFSLLWMVAIILLAMYADILRITRRHSRQISAQQNVAARFVPHNNDAQTVTSTVSLATHDPPIYKLTEVEIPTDHSTNQVPPPLPNVQKSVQAHPSSSRNTGGNGQGLKIDRKGLRQILRTLRTPLIVTSCFVMSWLPFTVSLTYASASGERLNSVIFKVVASLAAGNCTVNILVYLFTRKDYKKIFRKVIFRRQ